MIVEIPPAILCALIIILLPSLTAMAVILIIAAVIWGCSIAYLILSMPVAAYELLKNKRPLDKS